MRTFSKLIGKEEEGEKVLDIMDKEMEKVTTITNTLSAEEKPTVYWMWSDVYGTAGGLYCKRPHRKSRRWNVVSKWGISSKSLEHRF
jgi:iron complex transport system substrate-binding protein